MSGEGVVNQRLGPLLSGLLRQHKADASGIDVQVDVRLGINHAGLLSRSAYNKDHIRARLTHLIYGGGPCHCLTPDNGLDLRIRGHCNSVGDDGLGLRSKVIWIGGGNNHIAIFFLHSVGLGNLLVSLRNSPCDDADFVIARLCTGAASTGTRRIRANITRRSAGRSSIISTAACYPGKHNGSQGKAQNSSSHFPSPPIKCVYFNGHLHRTVKTKAVSNSKQLQQQLCRTCHLFYG